MSWILSISSHYSPLCWWKHAVSVAFCSLSHSGWATCSALLQLTFIYSGCCKAKGNLTRSWATTFSTITTTILCSSNLCLMCACFSYNCLSFNCSVVCQSSGQLKNICLHWLIFVRLYSGQTKPGYWHSTGKRPRHKHCICSLSQGAAQQWPFFAFLAKCVSVFGQSTLIQCRCNV